MILKFEEQSRESRGRVRPRNRISRPAPRVLIRDPFVEISHQFCNIIKFIEISKLVFIKILYLKSES